MTATIGVQTLLLVVFALQIKPGIQSVQLFQQVVQVLANKGTILYAMGMEISKYLKAARKYKR